MPAPRRQFVDTDYGQMHLRLAKPDVATKTPLICLHMSPQSGGAFARFMEKASAERLIVAPDYHGFGESDLPPENPPVRIEDYARTIWQALDSLKIDCVDLLGHHTGSKVAADMARQKPERVESIVMVSASSMSPEEFSNLKKAKSFDAIPLDEAGTRLMKLWAGIRQFCSPDLPLETLYEFVLDALRPGDAYQWANRAAFLYNARFTSVLKDLPHPITVFNPNDDLYAVTPNIMPYLKNGTLIDKPNWEHGLFDMKTEETVKAILQALDETLPKADRKKMAS